MRCAGDPTLIIEEASFRPKNRVHRDGLMQYAINPDDSIFFRYSGEADYEVSRNRIRVIPADENSRNITPRISGQMLGLLLRMRGCLVLHANVLERGGLALAILGSSGHGKSTISMELISRGFRLMSDDLCVLSNKKSRWTVYGGSSFLKMRSGKGAYKDWIPVDNVSKSTKIALAVALQPVGPVAMRPMRASQFLLELIRHAHIPLSLSKTGYEREHFDSASELAGSITSYSLDRGVTIGDASLAADLIEGVCE